MSHVTPLSAAPPSAALRRSSQPLLMASLPRPAVCSRACGGPHACAWVSVPPTIADDQTDFTVTRMAPVVLTCHSSGVPSPVVSWSKAGTALGPRGSGYRVSPSGKPGGRGEAAAEGTWDPGREGESSPPGLSTGARLCQPPALWPGRNPLPSLGSVSHSTHWGAAVLQGLADGVGKATSPRATGRRDLLGASM